MSEVKMIIETKRLFLRDMTEKDYDDLYMLFQEKSGTLEEVLWNNIRVPNENIDKEHICNFK